MNHSESIGCRTIVYGRHCSDGPLSGVVVGQSAFIDDIGSEPAGVDEMANAAGPRRVNDVVVLPRPLPRESWRRRCTAA